MIKYFIITLFMYMFIYKVCSYKIGGGYKIGTFCNYLWVTTYMDCMSYLNNKNNKINDCLENNNFSIRNDYSLKNNILISFIKCNNKTYEGRNVKNIKFSKYYKNCLYVNKCINKILNNQDIIIKNDDITCDFSFYQLNYYDSY